MGSVISSETKPKGWFGRNWIWLAIPLALTAWFAVPVAIRWLVCQYGEAGLEKAGQFGDQFGAVNALFTGLGLVAVWVTLRKQTDQINQVAREQISTQKRHEEQMIHARALRLLELHDEIETKFEWRTEGVKFEGRMAVDVASMRLLAATTKGDDVRKSEFVTDLAISVVEATDLPSLAPKTLEEVAARYQFLNSAVWKYKAEAYLKVLCAIVETAWDANRRGHPSVVELLEDTMSNADLCLLEMHSFVMPGLVSMLRDLQWRSSRNTHHNSVAWGTRFSAATTTSSAPAGAGPTEEVNNK